MDRDRHKLPKYILRHNRESNIFPQEEKNTRQRVDAVAVSIGNSFRTVGQSMKRRYHVLAIVLVILSFPIAYQLWDSSLSKTTSPTPPPPPPPPPPRTGGGGSTGSSGSSGSPWGGTNQTTPLATHGLILNQNITAGEPELQQDITFKFYYGNCRP